MNNPIRRKILDMLKNGDMTAGEIAAHFDISKPSISHHLDILKRAHLAVSLRKGQFIYYSLNTTVIDETLKWLIQFKSK